MVRPEKFETTLREVREDRLNAIDTRADQERTRVDFISQLITDDDNMHEPVIREAFGLQEGTAKEVYEALDEALSSLEALCLRAPDEPGIRRFMPPGDIGDNDPLVKLGLIEYQVPEGAPLITDVQNEHHGKVVNYLGVTSQGEDLINSLRQQQMLLPIAEERARLAGGY